MSFFLQGCDLHLLVFRFVFDDESSLKTRHGVVESWIQKSILFLPLVWLISLFKSSYMKKIIKGTSK